MYVYYTTHCLYQMRSVVYVFVSSVGACVRASRTAIVLNSCRVGVGVWWACMCVWVFGGRVCVCVFIGVCVYVSVYVSVYVYAYVCVCVCVLLYVCQNSRQTSRSTFMARELASSTTSNGKRDLFMCQKRSIIRPKRPIYGKTGLICRASSTASSAIRPV